MLIISIKNTRNTRGVVLLMTLVIVIVLAMVGGSILFSSLNQGTATQESVDDIKAQELAKGLMWKKSYSGDFSLDASDTQQIDGKTCTPEITEAVGSDKKSIKVTCR